MSNLKITFIQTQLFWEDIDKNLGHFSEKIAEINVETDVILLPEMFTSGFTMNVSKVAEMANGKAIQWMQKMAQQKNCVVAGSLAFAENNNYYNRFVWMSPDGGFEFYNKRHLFRMAEENNYYTAGDKNVIVQLKGFNIGLQVCYDLRFPVWSRRVEKENKYNYDVLLYVANWPERRKTAWQTLLLARAIENQSYVLGVNRIGKDDFDVNYTGDSAAINFLGEKISTTQSNAESIETISFSKDKLEQFRAAFPAAMDADEFEIKN